MNTRGASELIGYILIFAVAISSAFLLTMFGVSTLADSGEVNDVETGVQNLKTLRGGIAEVVQGAPIREVSLRSTDGGILYGTEYSINVSASGGNVSLTGANAINVTGTEIKHRISNDANVTYASGLIGYDQQQAARSTLRNGPDWQTTGSRFVLTLPLGYQQSGSSSLVSVAGTDKVPVVVERGSADEVSRVALDAEGNVTTMSGTVTVRGSSVTGAWGEYFEERFKSTDLDGDGSTEYIADTDGDGQAEVAGGSFETKRLYVTTVQIGVSLNEQV